DLVGPGIEPERRLRKGAARFEDAVNAIALEEVGLHGAILDRLGVAINAGLRSRPKALLETTNIDKHALDTLIAAQAVTRKLVLVTGNEREFGRVPRLRLENWLR